MVSMRDVIDGAVSLADIVTINHYLDMKQDIEYMVSEEAKKHGNSKRTHH